MRAACLFVLLSGLTLSFGCRAESETTSTTGVQDQYLLHVDDSNFAEVVLQSDQPVLVDFWATWCGPCKMIAPTVAEVSAEYSGRAKVAKLDIDESPGVASEYNIIGVPTLVVFQDGREVQRFVGADVTKSQLGEALDSAM